MSEGELPVALVGTLALLSERMFSNAAAGTQPCGLAGPEAFLPHGSRSAFFSGEFEQRLHRWLAWLKIDYVDGPRRRVEPEPRVDRCGCAHDENPAPRPPSPDGGGRDHMRTARVDERQPSEVEHHQPRVALGALQRTRKLRGGRATKLAGNLHPGDLAAAILKRADK